jgi:hypothetical protein
MSNRRMDDGDEKECIKYSNPEKDSKLWHQSFLTWDWVHLNCSGTSQMYFTVWISWYSLIFTDCEMLINSLEQSYSSNDNTACLVKKFPAFYGNGKFITVFTTANHWTLSWAGWTNSKFSNPLSLSLILILSLYLCLVLPNVSVPYGFLNNILSEFPFCFMCTICQSYRHVMMLKFLSFLFCFQPKCRVRKEAPNLVPRWW